MPRSSLGLHAVVGKGGVKEGSPLRCELRNYGAGGADADADVDADVDAIADADADVDANSDGAYIYSDGSDGSDDGRPL